MPRTARFRLYILVVFSFVGISLLSPIFSGLASAGAQSPAGSKIAFVYGENSGAEIYIMNGDGTGQTRVTSNNDYDYNPSWSADGGAIAFAKRRNNVDNIYKVEVSTGLETKLTNEDYPLNSTSPAWSPNGQKIVFTSSRTGRGSEIWTMNSDGSNQVRLTTSELYNISSIVPVYSVAWNPCWSPDGTKIAFMSYRDGNFNRDIYVMNADGSNQTRLTTHPADDYNPVWLPDGSKISFASTREGGHDVYLMNPDGSNQTNFTRNGISGNAQWSPDSSRIIFGKDLTSNSDVAQVYLMNSDGSGQVKLTNNLKHSGWAVWAPVASLPIPTYIISGRVTDRSGNGVSGATLTLGGQVDRSTQSDPSGYYSFGGLAAGQYSVTIAKAGNVFDPPTYSFAQLTQDQTANFIASTALTISGQVTGLGGNIVTLSLSGSEVRTTQTQGSNSEYSFTNVAAGGSYTIAPSNPYYNFEPPSLTFNNLATNQVANFVATRKKYTISGRVTRGGVGFSGVTITLEYSGGGGVVQTTTTDADGNYSMHDVAAGISYHLTPWKGPNYYFNQQSYSYEYLNADKTANFIALSANRMALGADTYRVGEAMGSIRVNVNRGGNASGVGTITVDYATSNGTASDASDYTAMSGKLIFAEGEYSKTINIPITDDAEVEGDETFFITLSNPTGEVDLIAPSRAQIVIDESVTVVQLSSATYTVDENQGFLNITATRSGNKSAPATVKYRTRDSTDANFRCDQLTGVASRKCDYHIASGKLRFAAGETTKQFTLSITNDVYVEGAETFNLTLSNPVGATLGQNNDVSITITDDDQASAANPVDQTSFFVRQLYVDLLSREPDPAGWQGWTNRIDQCGRPGQPPPPCDRVTVGGDGFLRSGEFFDRQFFVLRLYRTGLGRILRYDEVSDLAYVSGFLTDSELELNKQDLANEIASRAEFASRYSGLPNAVYVDALLQTAGVSVPVMPQAARDNWVAALNNSTRTKAQVLREISERQEVSAKYLQEAQVVSAYYGFFTRNPDGAYLVYLDRLQRGEITLADLANAFINAQEYRQRFGQ